MKGNGIMGNEVTGQNITKGKLKNQLAKASGKMKYQIDFAKE